MDKRTRLQLNQSRTYAKVIHKVVRDVFQSGNPADRVLGATFRDGRKFGSRDRRMIAETIFSIFRWWGWLQRLVDKPDELWVVERAASSEEWARILLAAHLLDVEVINPVALQWKQKAKIRRMVAPIDGETLAERAAQFAEIFGGGRPPEDHLMPKWVANRLPVRGGDKKRLLDNLSRRPPMWIRIQRSDRKAVLRELKAASLIPEPHPGLPNAVKLGYPRVNLYEIDSFRKGQFDIQDFASQVIGASCRAKAGERWWDACAGAGGKTLQLAFDMESKGTLVATDVREYKLKDLKKRARRAGFSNIQPRAWKGRGLPVKDANFDGVLVDAPCSCSGTWRRNPDARWTSQAEDIPKAAALQFDILDRSAAAVKPGGVLVYATCSFFQEENEGVLTDFLSKHPEFELDEIVNPITGKKERGMLHIWPWEADCDATFVARMIRKEEG